eukprot:jgi/Tetstr1/453254/TSEL_040270.t1
MDAPRSNRPPSGTGSGGGGALKKTTSLKVRDPARARRRSVTFQEEDRRLDRRRSDPGDIQLPTLEHQAEFSFGLLPTGGIYEADIAQFRGPPPRPELAHGSISGVEPEWRVVAGRGEGEPGRVVVRVAAVAQGSFSFLLRLVATELGSEGQVPAEGSLEVQVRGSVMPRAKGTPQLHDHVRRVGTHPSAATDDEEL